MEQRKPANKPAAPNAGIVSQLTIEHHWPGVGELVVSHHRTLTMKHERGIKRVGYITLAALLALVAFSYWVSHRIEHGETPAFVSEGAASVVASICALIFYAAVALAGFIVIRAFYVRLTQSDSGQKHEHDS